MYTKTILHAMPEGRKYSRSPFINLCLFYTNKSAGGKCISTGLSEILKLSHERLYSSNLIQIGFQAGKKKEDHERHMVCVDVFLEK